jgi:hypothetical protein
MAMFIPAALRFAHVFIGSCLGRNCSMIPFVLGLSEPASACSNSFQVHQQATASATIRLWKYRFQLGSEM